MALSNYLENKLIDSLFRNISFTPPSILYVALCTNTPVSSNTGSTISEVIGGDYVRILIAANADNWFTTQGDTSSLSTGSSGTTGNINFISWGIVAWSAAINGIAICDAPSGGNLLYFTSIVETIVPAGSNVTIAVNTLNVGFA